MQKLFKGLNLSFLMRESCLLDVVKMPPTCAQHFVRVSLTLCGLFQISSPKLKSFCPIKKPKRHQPAAAPLVPTGTRLHAVSWLKQPQLIHISKHNFMTEKKQTNLREKKTWSLKWSFRHLLWNYEGNSTVQIKLFKTELELQCTE